MRNCSNCINGCYSYIDDQEELICGIDKYNERKVNDFDVCEYHNFVPNNKLECNKLFLIDGDKPGLLLVHEVNGNVDKICRIYRFNDSFADYIGIETESFVVGRNREFTFRTVDDDENGLFGVFTDFYENLKIHEKYNGVGKVAISSNRLVVIVDFPDKLVVSNIDDYDYYDIIEQLYEELEMLSPEINQDNALLLKLT